VLFRSKANNLAAGSFSGTENLYLRDLQLGTTYALTTTGVLGASAVSDGRFIAFSGQSSNIYVWDSQAAARVWTNRTSAISALSLSADGTRVAYSVSNAVYAADWAANTNRLLASASYLGSRAGLRYSRDGRFLTYAAAPTLSGSNQVFVYDFQTGTNSLISRMYGSAGTAHGNSDSPDLSADGRFVVYRSPATDLLPGANSNSVPNLFLYDLLTGTTSLLTASRYGGAPADNRSCTPVFSGDGRTLVFQSWASDLVAQDFNHGGDVFALAFLYASIVPGATPGDGPTLTWPARPGETYHVQFKNTLSDSNWQDVTGTVTIAGGQAHLTDLAPAAGQRFYRIVAF